MKKITKDEFRLIKSRLRWNKNQRVVASSVKRSLAKVAIIAACKNFEEYERIKKAEHPPLKYSLRGEIEDLKKRVTDLENKGAYDGKPDVI